MLDLIKDVAAEIIAPTGKLLPRYMRPFLVYGFFFSAKSFLLLTYLPKNRFLLLLMI